MRNNKRILAIDPGTHYIGVAVLVGPKLVYYGVKTLSRRKPTREALKEGRKVIGLLIDDFSPSILAVEKTFFAKSSNGTLLNTFAREIVWIGKRRGLSVEVMAANTVRKIVCKNGKATKQDVGKAVVSLYPELSPYLSSDRRWKEKFYYNMFDAVALGLASNDKHEMF
ncbi:MAG TPA: crossover junction endodeoxyribonuclease RuvC [Candidatus Acidoferrales bacterium]|nr:crossover junction endodeoxyribonuclease RuvC [Candidatus Acidoferrales bacterium]